MPAVIFDAVEKTYAGARGTVRALDGVSFTIEPGEFFGLLGPNGAGKTTTLRMLYTLMTPDQGAVRVDGFDAHRAATEVGGEQDAEGGPA